MRYVPRLVDLRGKLAKKSHFLFGPRQTGKSTLIRQTLPDAVVYDLLDSTVFLALNRRPSQLREELSSKTSLVVIDEIQKIPELLDEVHLLIEKRGIRFLLTGSSARKLRRGGVNLLGGRARSLFLHPLVSSEVPNLDLLRALSYGLLPAIHQSDDPDADLAAYAGDYLNEEIAQEGLARNIPAFSRFLEVAALCNGTMINFSNIARDAQVARSTVQEYFRILEDTRVAHTVTAWKKSTRRKPITTSKFYFFDTGVVRHLRNEGRIMARSPAFGPAFETFIHHELRSHAEYTGGPLPAYWRSTSNLEVDFILSDSTAIEVKGSASIGPQDLRGLRALKEEALLRHYIVVSLVERPRLVDGIEILPWRDFLERLWAGDFHR